MSIKYMKIKRLVIPFLTVLIIVGQMTGCAPLTSKEAAEMDQESNEVIVEVIEQDKEKYKEALEIVGQSVIENQKPDIQEVTGVNEEDGSISYTTSNGDSGILEKDTTVLEEAWGVSQEEIDANMENMTTEEFEEWLDQQDQEFNQRLEEAAKEVSDEVMGEALAEIQNQQPQQSQQETQEVKQPQQTQEQNNTGVTDYTVYDDGTVSWKNADGTTTIDISNQIEGSVRELSDLAKEATVN